MSFQLPTYTWRGKTYKTSSGLFKACVKAYPGCSQSFSEHAMHLRLSDGTVLVFVRAFGENGNSVIAAEAE